MRKIVIFKDKIVLEDEIEEVNEGVVKKIGNGAMILSSKKHIGKKVYVLVRKD
jgi:putative transposon-encoded protein